MIRPLISNVLVSAFLDGIYNDEEDMPFLSFVSKIAQAELTIKAIDLGNATLNGNEYRDPRYFDERARWVLRKKIVNELFTQERIRDDNRIKLGYGGALPFTPLCREGQAYIMTGLPASGKSGIAEMVADRFGAALVDSDYVKRKLPEFKDFNAGASISHPESAAVIFGSVHFNKTSFVSLLDKFSADRTNIVVPKIGDSVQDLLNLRNKLVEFGYEVHLTLVSLDRIKATKRALHRFKATKRYVPLSLIYDVYGNEPILTYYRIKENHESDFCSIGKISNDVPFGARPKCVYYNNDRNPAYLYQ